MGELWVVRYCPLTGEVPLDVTYVIDRDRVAEDQHVLECCRERPRSPLCGPPRAPCKIYGPPALSTLRGGSLQSNPLFAPPARSTGHMLCSIYEGHTSVFTHRGAAGRARMVARRQAPRAAGAGDCRHQTASLVRRRVIGHAAASRRRGARDRHPVEGVVAAGGARHSDGRSVVMVFVPPRARGVHRRGVCQQNEQRLHLRFGLLRGLLALNFVVPCCPLLPFAEALARALFALCSPWHTARGKYKIQLR